MLNEFNEYLLLRQMQIGCDNRNWLHFERQNVQPMLELESVREECKFIAILSHKT